MGISGALRDLAGFVEECERAEGVDRVDLNGAVEPAAVGELTTTVELELDLCDPDPGLAAGSATVDADGRLAVEMRSVDEVVPVATDLTVEPVDATGTADGTVAVTLSVRSDATPNGSSSTATDGSGAGTATRSGVGDRGTGAVSTPADGELPSSGREATRSPEDATTPATDDATPPGEGDVAAGRDRDVPPFEDPELLAEVYEQCDTFAEMTDALGMSVTAETVRRYMMDFGIHEPNSYDTGGADETGDGSDGAGSDESGDGKGHVDDSHGAGALDDEGTDPLDDEGTDPLDDANPAVGGVDDSGAGASTDDPDGDGADPVVVTDGVGLPDDVTVEALIDTVRRSNTIYEVTRGLGIDREDTLEMLRDLDLLSLVVGRLATEADRDLSREEIVDRIRQASETG